MCDVVYDPADVSSTSNPVARKQYRCSACERPIFRGEQHYKLSCLHDGAWSDWRTHTTCIELTKYIALDLCEQRFWVVPDGPRDQRDTIREHMREHPLVLTMWRDHLRARNRAERRAA